MAPAKPITKWRRTIRLQLNASNLPVNNEMAYRQYVNVVFNASQLYGLSENLNEISRAELHAAIHAYLNASYALDWEKDVVWYVVQLLMDHIDGDITPPFQGASMTCGDCGFPVKINNDRSRYTCPCCNAQVRSGENAIPIGIPTNTEIRKERARLHQRLETLIANKASKNAIYRSVSIIQKKPVELTHIGYITTKDEVSLWDDSFDTIHAHIQAQKLDLVRGGLKHA